MSDEEDTKAPAGDTLPSLEACSAERCVLPNCWCFSVSLHLSRLFDVPCTRSHCDSDGGVVADWFSVDFRMAACLEKIASDKSINPFFAQKYANEAAKYWEKFYGPRFFLLDRLVRGALSILHVLS
jgi:hypothetical protein